VGENYKVVNARAQEEASASHLKIFRKLTKIRKEPRFKIGTYQGHLTNNNNIYTYIRQNENDFAIIILNFGKSEEVVNVKTVYENVNLKTLRIYTSSMESGLKDGDSVDANAVRIKSSNGIVLVSSSLKVKLSGVLVTLLAIASISSFFI
jgi:alpha-glucosidase